MNNRFAIYTGAFACILGLLLFSGCRTTTRDISPDETIHYDEDYDFSDKRAIVSALAESITARPPLGGTDERPVVISYGIANRTTEHISTGGIMDDIRQKIIAAGKARFVNERQREHIEEELRYQYGGNVSPQTRIAMARQVGAEYMLTGTLRSIEKQQPDQVRFKRRTLKYYSLTLELTGIESGLIEWTDSVEIVREAAKPFIGW